MDKLKEYLRLSLIELEQSLELGKNNPYTESYIQGRIDELEDIQSFLLRVDKGE